MTHGSAFSAANGARSASRGAHAQAWGTEGREIISANHARTTETAAPPAFARSDRISGSG